MAGRLIYVMGPSGAGKDTILQALVGLMGSAVYLAPRVVTRRIFEAERAVVSALSAKPGADVGAVSQVGLESDQASVLVQKSASDEGSVSEDVAMSDATFDKLTSSGVFAMSWRANGLAYGIKRVDIDPKLSQGIDVLINGSRQYLAEACEQYPALVPVLLDVPAALLKERLQARGRESSAQIQQRLDRNALFATLTAAARHRDIIHVDNTGSIERAVAQLHASLIADGGTEADADVNVDANADPDVDADAEVDTDAGANWNANSISPGGRSCV